MGRTISPNAVRIKDVEIQDGGLFIKDLDLLDVFEKVLVKLSKIETHLSLLTGVEIDDTEIEK